MNGPSDLERRRPHSPPPPRILVVKLADMGDALLATPALARLRRNLPAARIEVLTTANAALAFERSGLVDEVIVFDKQRYDRPAGLLAAPSAVWALGRDLRARGYDATLSLHPMTTRFGALKHAGLALVAGAPIRAGLAREGRGAWRSWFVNHAAPDRGFDGAHVVEAGEGVVDAALRALGCAPTEVEAEDRHPRFGVGAREAAEAEALLDELAEASDEIGEGADRRGWVAIHPGSGGFSTARRWPAEHFARLIDVLEERGYRCLVLGREGDGGNAVIQACRRPPAALIDRTPLPLLAAVLARVDLLVANDGGVMHLATAVGTPVTALFGPSNERHWGPWWPGFDREGRERPSPHRTLSLDLACRPCFYRGYALGSPAGCPQRDCLAWLKPERVVSVVEDLLES